MAEINKTNNAKVFLKMRNNWNSRLLDMKNATATSENSLTVSHKLKHNCPNDPAIPLVGIYPTKMKTYVYTNMLYLCLASFTYYKAFKLHPLCSMCSDCIISMAE